MRWRGRRESTNIEDRRGERRGFGFPFPGGSGGVRFPSGGGSVRRGGGIGIVGLLIILGLMLFFGIDPSVLMQGGGPGGGGANFPDIRLPQQPDTTNFPMPGGRAQIERPKTAGDDELRHFVAVVLGTTEDVWSEEFKQFGARYRDPTLVLFKGATRSACGMGMAAMGPFYCPGDQKVYIDLDFYTDGASLRDRP
jgi:predicted metalloprotease